MNEIKNQPIDKRTYIPFILRLLAATAVFTAVMFVLFKYTEDITEKIGISEHLDWIKWAAPITACLMYLRYVKATFNRKWGYAFAVYVYDVMKRPDADICPRCKTKLDKDIFDIDYNTLEPKGEVENCACPNTNCGLSLQKKMTFSQCPSTKRGLRAFVLNLGVRRDYEESVFTKLVRLVLALAVSGAVASLIAIKLIPLIEKLF